MVQLQWFNHITDVLYTWCLHPFTTDAEDYATLGGEISIPVGADVGDTYCKDIVLVADSKVEEEEELFSVSLMSPAGEVQYVLVPNKNATVTIRDGDSKKSYCRPES